MIFVFTLIVLLVFIGFAVDAGSLYVNYAQLQRAVDAAAVSAANNYRKPNLASTPPITIADRINQMQSAAREEIKLHNINDSVDVHVHICDENGDGTRDAALSTEFYNQCPDTPTQLPRKLVWVDAVQQAPIYFLHLIGFNSISLHTTAIGEAAPLDVVVAIDTSETMGNTAGGLFNPDACNAANSCQPLKKAKEAVEALIDTLFDGEDQIGIVTFDTQATVSLPLTLINPVGQAENKNSVIFYAIDHNINVHDNPDPNIQWETRAPTQIYNPINPEDNNDDGVKDYDPHYVAYDWNGDGSYWNIDGNPGDDTGAATWLANPLHSLSAIDTCTGCGLRVASNMLKGGRTNAVWVMIVLSDGAANLTDTAATGGLTGAYAQYPRGFCPHPYWADLCIDKRNKVTATNRTCIVGANCPSEFFQQSTPTNYMTNTYSPMDYAMDMVDQAALTTPSYSDETATGNNIAIYSIRLGDSLNPDPILKQRTEYLLRYMAGVGENGNRASTSCDSAAVGASCGQYYHALTANDLLPVFNDIAARIFTRITK